MASSSGTYEFAIHRGPLGNEPTYIAKFFAPFLPNMARRLDELLVGAPLYSDETVGAETGRVYVYRNVGVRVCH